MRISAEQASEEISFSRRNSRQDTLSFKFFPFSWTAPNRMALPVATHTVEELGSTATRLASIPLSPRSSNFCICSLIISSLFVDVGNGSEQYRMLDPEQNNKVSLSRTCIVSGTSLILNCCPSVSHKQQRRILKGKKNGKRKEGVQ